MKYDCNEHQYGNLSNGGGCYNYKSVIRHTYENFVKVWNNELPKGYQINDYKLCNLMSNILKQYYGTFFAAN